MIERLTPVETKEELEQHQKDFGTYNYPPPGFQEITAEEFAQSGFFTWCVEGMEYRQIMADNIKSDTMLNPVKGYLSIKLFFMNHGDGYGISHDYWDEKVRYFKFAKCYHDYKELPSPGMHTHVCKCTKCGDVWEYDSSG